MVLQKKKGQSCAEAWKRPQHSKAPCGFVRQSMADCKEKRRHDKERMAFVGGQLRGLDSVTATAPAKDVQGCCCVKIRPPLNEGHPSPAATKPPNPSVLIKQSTFFGELQGYCTKESSLVRLSRCLFTVHSLNGSIDSDTTTPNTHLSQNTPEAEDWYGSRQKSSDKRRLRRVEYRCNPPGGYCWKENQGSLD